MRDVQECIDEIGRAGSKIFSTLDLTSGFWQMLLNPDSQKYTAFTVPGLGQFEWNSSPMGLLGAPGSFQRLMEIVIHNLKNIIAYIDDLLVHTKSHEEQLDSLDQLFTRLRQHGLKLNLKKSFFGCEEVSYLGFRLTPDGVLPGIDKLRAVREALPPSNVHEVRQFMGLCNFFRGHVRNFAQISAPLNQLTRKEDPWKGGPLPEAPMKAFRQLQLVLNSEPVIHYPQPELTYALVTNGGDSGFGAILAQVLPEGGFQTISYASRKLKDHEKNYAPFLKEMAATVWAMEHYSVYLKGKHFILFSDNKEVTEISTIHRKTLNRLQEAMSLFDFEIMSQSGSELPADLRSQNLVNQIDFDNSKWKNFQDKEPWIYECKEWLLNNKTPTVPMAKHFTSKAFAQKLFIEDNLLWMRFQGNKENKRPNCLIVPNEMGDKILQEEQGKIFAKSDSKAKIKQKLLQHYWWPTMDTAISNFFPSPEVPIETINPNFRINVDIFHMPTKSDKNKSFVLCLTDNETKYAELIALKDDESKTVAEAIFISWILRFGIPSELSFHKNSNFRSTINEELSKLLDVNATFQPRCLPREGVTNKKIEKSLIELTRRNILDWESYIPSIMFCYNTSFQRKLNASPHFCLYGQNARQPAFSTNLQQRYYGQSSAADKFNILQLAKQIANEHFEDQTQIYNETFDQQMAPHSFLLNDLVCFQGQGPYKIVQFKPHNNAILQTENLKICVNIKNLSNFSNSDFIPIVPNFQKQGGDQEFENRNRKNLNLTNKQEKKEDYKSKLRNHKPTEEMKMDNLEALLEQQADKDLTPKLIKKPNLINVVHDVRRNPLMTYLHEEFNKKPNKNLIKKQFPSYWTDAQIINYQFSGDINEGPDDPNFISLEEAGAVPIAAYQTYFQNIPPPPVQPAELQVQPPQPQHARQTDRQPATATPRMEEAPPVAQPGDLPLPRPGASSASAPTTEGRGEPLARIRPEIRNGTFHEASRITDLNPFEAAYFKEAFSWEIEQAEVQRREAQKAARSSFRLPKFKTKQTSS